MDLNLHAGLEKGNTIPIGTGGYLRDSFRRQVLVPAFRSVQEELKSNRKSDVIVESILAGTILTLVGGIIMLATYSQKMEFEFVSLKGVVSRLLKSKEHLWLRLPPHQVCIEAVLTGPPLCQQDL